MIGFFGSFGDEIRVTQEAGKRGQAVKEGRERGCGGGTGGRQKMSSTSRRLGKRLLLKRLLLPSSPLASSRLPLILIGSRLLLQKLLLQKLLLLLHHASGGRGGVPAAEGDGEAEEDVAFRQDLFFFKFSFFSVF